MHCDQAQPKVRTLAGGGCFVSWFDNSTGGYDVRLQSLDGGGAPLFGANGILIADRNLSWTTDYGFDIDADGNAYLAFSDDRSGLEQITATKVSPAGVQLWGATGKQLTDDATAKYSPKIVATTDGASVIAWTGETRKGGAVFLAKLDPTGAVIWDVTISPSRGYNLSFSDIVALDRRRRDRLLGAAGRVPLPPSGDVTYLKYFQDDRYNYQAYNTVRMYYSTLLQGGTSTSGLWNELAGVVGWYAREFGIDGLMIDMAHALPGELASRIIRAAREVDPEFAFWAEDFSRTPGQGTIGYNAVLGGQWACQHRRTDFRDMLAWLGRTPELLPHLAAPETHNTPRAAAREGGETYARYAWAVSCFIPGIPYIHSGFEFGKTPSATVSTGLSFWWASR